MVHQETTLELQPLNILIGPNGSGKSAFFDALLNFSMLARGNLREAFGPYPYSFWATLHHGAMKFSKIGYAVQLSKARTDNESLNYEIQYAQQGSTEADRFTIWSEKLSYGDKNPKTVFDRGKQERFPGYKELELEADRSVLSSVRQVRVSGSPPADIDPLVVYCAQQVSRFNKFRLEPYLLSQPSPIPDVSVSSSTGEEASVSMFSPRLGYRGENLAGTLFYLRMA
jgi:energy-coupling factor transporter ATP-binding protein EcfA2